MPNEWQCQAYLIMVHSSLYVSTFSANLTSSSEFGSVMMVWFLFSRQHLPRWHKSPAWLTFQSFHARQDGTASPAACSYPSSRPAPRQQSTFGRSSRLVQNPTVNPSKNDKQWQLDVRRNTLVEHMTHPTEVHAADSGCQCTGSAGFLHTMKNIVAVLVSGIQDCHKPKLQSNTS